MELINKLENGIFRFKIVEDFGIPPEYMENKYGDWYITAKVLDTITLYKKNICLFDTTANIPTVLHAYNYDDIIPTYIFGEKYTEHNLKILDDDFDNYVKMTDAEYYELNANDFDYNCDDEEEDNYNLTDISDDDEMQLD
jgi:hypothetical protein